MNEFKTKFERRFEDETRLGSAPVEAEDKEAAKEKFLEQVEGDEADFYVYNVKKAL